MSDTPTRRDVLAGLGALLALTGTAQAQPARGGGDPFALQTEYSADAIFGSGRNARPGRFGRTRGALRQEIDGGGGANIVIVRLDQNVAYSMLPGMRVAVESDLRSLNLPLGSLTGQGGGGLRKTAGPRETIGGVATTRYRVETVPPTAAQFDGDVWATDRGIVMKVVGEGAYNGRRTDLSATYTNIREGRLEPSLFELPGGYRKIIVPIENLQQMLESFGRIKLPR